MALTNLKIIYCITLDIVIGGIEYLRLYTFRTRIQLILHLCQWGIQKWKLIKRFITNRNLFLLKGSMICDSYYIYATT